MSFERSIPFFIKARSPQGLRRLMIENNAKHGLTFKYFDIQNVKGQWYAWYYKQLDSLNKEDIKGLEDGDTKQ